MDEAWRELKVGDRVRIVRLPSAFADPGYVLHEDTLALYHRLIAAGTVLPIDEIDEFGHPWTDWFPLPSTEAQSALEAESGNEPLHTLALNDDSWERADLPETAKKCNNGEAA